MFIGTTNLGKVAEFASILAPLGITFGTVSLEVPETEPSFEGNARLKALAYAAHVGGVVVSEDSGLVVPVLDGLPGPWSARFWSIPLGMHASTVGSLPEGRRAPPADVDAANNALLLGMMRGIEQPHRAARLVVRLVVARPNEILFEAGAEVHGWVAEEARGTNGFGYDPIFVGQDTFGKTYAELDPVRKNLRSHRRKVLAEFGLWVARAVKDGVLSCA